MRVAIFSLFFLNGNLITRTSIYCAPIRRHSTVVGHGY